LDQIGLAFADFDDLNEIVLSVAPARLLDHLIIGGVDLVIQRFGNLAHFGRVNYPSLIPSFNEQP